MTRPCAIGLIGAGRIGALHARIIAKHPGSVLHAVHDTSPEFAHALARQHGALVAPTVDHILDDPAIDAVVVASRTDTHADLITACVQARKPVLCEKPIDLTLERVRECHRRIQRQAHHVQIGFNRRFDPNFQRLRDAIQDGEVGRVESVHIITRVPTPPPYRYVRESGGLFRDMTIHDFDLVRFLLDQEPVSVYAQGAALIDPGLRAEGDIDSAMVTLGFADGSAAHITNARRCAYGLDHRVEVFGAEGLISLRNGRDGAFQRSDRQGTDRSPLHHDSPILGYYASFEHQWAAFAESLHTRQAVGASFTDGWNALALAQAAYDSLESQRAVDPRGLCAPMG